MSKYLSDFTSRADIQDTDTLVGYRTAAVGGSGRWTWAAVKTWIKSWLALGDVTDVRRGTAAITTDAQSVAVTFGSEMSAAPLVVVATVWVADGASDLVGPVHVQEDSITTTGFTARLSGPAPAGAKLSYVATR